MYAGACKECISAYLTAGFGSKPKVFKLSDLLSNGTNVGRKQKDLKPILGPHHPYSLTDGRTTILTENGWKMIKDIEIGEKVLTHKGRFREVVSKINGYRVPKDYPIKQRYEIKYELYGKGSKYHVQTLSLTAEHKVLTQRGWLEVRHLKTIDKLIKLMIIIIQHPKSRRIHSPNFILRNNLSFSVYSMFCFCIYCN